MNIYLQLRASFVIKLSKEIKHLPRIGESIIYSDEKYKVVDIVHKYIGGYAPSIYIICESL